MSGMKIGQELCQRLPRQARANDVGHRDADVGHHRRWVEKRSHVRLRLERWRHVVERRAPDFRRKEQRRRHAGRVAEALNEAADVEDGRVGCQRDGDPA